MQYPRWNFAKPLGSVNKCQYCLIFWKYLEGKLREAFLGMQIGALLSSKMDGSGERPGGMSQKNGVRLDLSHLSLHLTHTLLSPYFSSLSCSAAFSRSCKFTLKIHLPMLYGMRSLVLPHPLSVVWQRDFSMCICVCVSVQKDVSPWCSKCPFLKFLFPQYESRLIYKVTFVHV